MLHVIQHRARHPIYFVVRHPTSRVRNQVSYVARYPTTHTTISI